MLNVEIEQMNDRLSELRQTDNEPNDNDKLSLIPPSPGKLLDITPPTSQSFTPYRPLFSNIPTGNYIL